MVIDLLICCGDFQAVRNLDDLECMSVPKKYLELGTFWKYYSGEAVAPYPTIFIGGNHEASNYLWELYYGGWVCPNIYYLGHSGVINFGDLRVGGLSGIFDPTTTARAITSARPTAATRSRPRTTSASSTSTSSRLFASPWTCSFRTIGPAASPTTATSPPFSERKNSSPTRSATVPSARPPPRNSCARFDRGTGSAPTCTSSSPRSSPTPRATRPDSSRWTSASPTRLFAGDPPPDKSPEGGFRLDPEWLAILRENHDRHSVDAAASPPARAPVDGAQRAWVDAMLAARGDGAAPPAFQARRRPTTRASTEENRARARPRPASNATRRRWSSWTCWPWISNWTPRRDEAAAAVGEEEEEEEEEGEVSGVRTAGGARSAAAAAVCSAGGAADVRPRGGVRGRGMGRRGRDAVPRRDDGSEASSAAAQVGGRERDRPRRRRRRRVRDVSFTRMCIAKTASRVSFLRRPSLRRIVRRLRYIQVRSLSTPVFVKMCVYRRFLFALSPFHHAPNDFLSRSHASTAASTLGAPSPSGSPPGGPPTVRVRVDERVQHRRSVHALRVRHPHGPLFIGHGWSGVVARCASHVSRSRGVALATEISGRGLYAHDRSGSVMTPFLLDCTHCPGSPMSCLYHISSDPAVVPGLYVRSTLCTIFQTRPRRRCRTSSPRSREPRWDPRGGRRARDPRS